MARIEGKITDQQDLLQPVFYEPDNIDRASIANLVQHQAAGRKNWVIGSGGSRTAEVIRSMHQRGFTGPLWEYLAR